MRPNYDTIPTIEDLITWRKELGLKTKEKENATIIDFTEGGYEAGATFAEICLGGLGTVGFTETEIGEIETPAVQVQTNHPVLSTIDCQKADLVIEETLASGPGKLLLNNKKSNKQTKKEEYCILTLETKQEPTESMIDEISNRLEIDKENIFLLYAPTNSLVGSIQISARIIETALHKLDRKNYEINEVKNAFGTAPIAPISDSTETAIGRTNDAIIYGGYVNLITEKYSSEFSDLVSRNSEKYGKLMKEVFKEVNYNFNKIDQDFFAPAKVLVNNKETGKLHQFGKKDPDILTKSFGMEE